MSFFCLNTLHQVLFLSGFTLIIISIVFFSIKNKIYFSILLLFTGGLLLRFGMANLPQILGMWDEQYHAVVAKNILTDPFKPMLFKKHYVEYNGLTWTCDTVWLYKQPLFLWQIAISYKIFGVNLFALRFPSVIMASLVILLIFRMGTIAVNRETGYLSALLYTLANCQLEFVGIYRFLDHNDQAFMFYITVSIWSWTEYSVSKSKFWLILTGIFSGCSILVKWLAGLLVYSGWGILLLMDKEKNKNLRHFLDIFIAFLITIMVALPWQLYIQFTFPEPNERAIETSIAHLFTVLDEHYGEWWFHIKQLNYIYGLGELVPYIVALSLLAFPFFSKQGIGVAYLTYVIVTYVFFSIVQTKMIGFCIIVAPVIYVMLGNLNNIIISFIRNRIKKTLIAGVVLFLILAVTGYLNMAFNRIQKEHDPCNKEPYQLEDALLMGKEVFLRLNNELPKGEVVIFNCRQFENIACMFYTNYTAYDFFPSEKDYMNLKNKKIRIAVFDNHKLPEYLLNDNDVIKIKTNLFPE